LLFFTGKLADPSQVVEADYRPLSRMNLPEAKTVPTAAQLSC
jgi:hypothetical protein